jgi:hypothetical protein
MESMDPELERVLCGLDEAVQFTKSYRFEMTEDYLALLAQVEALPRNQSGSNKSAVWPALQAYVDSFKGARLLPREP